MIVHVIIMKIVIRGYVFSMEIQENVVCSVMGNVPLDLYVNLSMGINPLRALCACLNMKNCVCPVRTMGIASWGPQTIDVA